MTCLDPRARGHSVEGVVYEYGWRDVVLYALGIGAGVERLEYIYEALGPAVFETFAVVPSGRAVHTVLAESSLGSSLADVVHRAQRIRLHRPIPPRGRIVTDATIETIADLGAMALVVVRTESFDDRGDALFDTEWELLFRNSGGFGGSRPEAGTRQRAPERAPDVVVHEDIPAGQAALYRLSGDFNPLHIDPDAARRVGYEAPILHGLCTLGLAVRAARAGLGSTSRVVALSGHFGRPVMPGDRIVIEAWRTEGGMFLRAYRADSPLLRVLSHCVVEIA